MLAECWHDGRDDTMVGNSLGPNTTWMPQADVKAIEQKLDVASTAAKQDGRVSEEESRNLADIQRPLDDFRRGEWNFYHEHKKSSDGGMVIGAAIGVAAAIGVTMLVSRNMVNAVACDIQLSGAVGALVAGSGGAWAGSSIHKKINEPFNAQIFSAYEQFGPYEAEGHFKH